MLCIYFTLTPCRLLLTKIPSQLITWRYSRSVVSFKFLRTEIFKRRSDGDLQLGNKEFNAMSRLVRRWIYNVPTLSVLFDSITHAQEQKRQCETERNRAASVLFNDPQRIKIFHQMTNEVGANEFGPAAYAGTIMVVLGNLLACLRNDLHVKHDDWMKNAPLIEGYSIGAIIEAAANNFRHHDEWARTEPPKDIQLKSISVIAAILKVKLAPDGIRHPIRQNVCPDIIAVLSENNFDQLNRNFFAFATSMVDISSRVSQEHVATG